MCINLSTCVDNSIFQRWHWFYLPWYIFLCNTNLFQTLSIVGVKFSSLQIWDGLMMSLWTNRIWQKWHNMTFEDRAKKVIQLILNSSGTLDLGAARGYIESLSSLRPPCWRGHRALQGTEQLSSQSKWLQLLVVSELSWCPA